MTLDESEQQELREYLLGNIPSEELSSLEERLLTDPRFYQELSIAEEELVDAYARDGLSPYDQERVEKYFLLSPPRQRKLLFAQILRRYLDASKVTQPTPETSEQQLAKIHTPTKKSLGWFASTTPAMRYSLAAAWVIIIAIGSFALFRYWKSKNTNQNPSVVTIVLVTGQTRQEGQTNRVSVPSGTSAVRLDLLLTESEYSHYDVALLEESGAEIWNEKNLKAVNEDGRRLIQLTIPAQVLRAEDYRIRVVGTHSDGNSDPLSSYQFRVER